MDFQHCQYQDTLTHLGNVDWNMLCHSRMLLGPDHLCNIQNGKSLDQTA